METKACRKSFRLKGSLADQLKNEAFVLGVSENSLIEEILNNHYTVGNKEDESIMIYKYESFERYIKKLDKKIEELGKLFVDYLIFYFRTEPGCPKTEEDEQMLARGHQNTIDFISAHRNKIMRDDQTFMQSIYGSLLEDSPDF